MAKKAWPTPGSVFAKTSPEIAQAFAGLRATAADVADVDREMVELILITSFALRGFETAFKNHVLDLAREGTPLDRIRRLVMVPMGATMLGIEVMRALTWIDEVETMLEADQ